MQLIQTVAPAQEPISLEDTKDFLRVLDTDSDNLITSLIVAVREHVENVTNRQLERATFELLASDFISKLPKNPISSIEKIEYMNADGNYVLLDASTYYLYERNGIGYISYSEIPNILDHKQAVKITFISGYVTVPETIKQYIRITVSNLFENKEPWVIGASVAKINGELIENLLSPHKIRSI